MMKSKHSVLTFRGWEALVIVFFFASTLAHNIWALPDSPTVNDFNVTRSDAWVQLWRETKGQGDEIFQTTNWDSRLLTVSLRLDGNYNATISLDLGFVYFHCGRIDDAIRVWWNAIRRSRDNSAVDHAVLAKLSANLAFSLHLRGYVGESVHFWEQSLSANPNQPAALAQLVVRAMSICAKWEYLDEWMFALKDIIEQQLHANAPPCIDPFNAESLPFPISLSARIARAHGIVVHDRVTNSAVRTMLSSSTLPPPHMPHLVIGFLAKEFGSAQNGMLRSAFQGHSPRTRMFGFAWGPYHQDDGETERQRIVNVEFDKFFDVSGREPLSIASVVNSAGVHILVDLAGWVHDDLSSQVIAYLPAALQVSYIMDIHTSGLPSLHYTLTDARVAPTEFADTFSERLSYMPFSYTVSTHASQFPNVNVRNSHLTSNQDLSLQIARKFPEMTRTKNSSGMARTRLGSFNQAYKIHPETFAVWMRVLRENPRVTLAFVRYNYCVESQRHLEANAASLGVSPLQLEFWPPRQQKDHLLRVRHGIDLHLDTGPVLRNGQMVTLDILWAGTPVVTTPGERRTSRVASGLLSAMHCSSMIGRTLEDYHAIISRTIQSSWARAKMSSCLGGDLYHKIYDRHRWLSDLERTLITMWDGVVALGHTEASKRNHPHFIMNDAK